MPTICTNSTKLSMTGRAFSMFLFCIFAFSVYLHKSFAEIFLSANRKAEGHGGFDLQTLALQNALNSCVLFRYSGVYTLHLFPPDCLHGVQLLQQQIGICPNCESFILSTFYFAFFKHQNAVTLMMFNHAIVNLYFCCRMYILKLYARGHSRATLHTLSATFIQPRHCYSESTRTRNWSEATLNI